MTGDRNVDKLLSGLFKIRPDYWITDFVHCLFILFTAGFMTYLLFSCLAMFRKRPK